MNSYLIPEVWGVGPSALPAYNVVVIKMTRPRSGFYLLPRRHHTRCLDMLSCASMPFDPQNLSANSHGSTTAFSNGPLALSEAIFALCSTGTHGGILTESTGQVCVGHCRG